MSKINKVTYVKGDNDAGRVIGRQLDFSTEASMVIVVRRDEPRTCKRLLIQLSISVTVILTENITIQFSFLALFLYTCEAVKEEPDVLAVR